MVDNNCKHNNKSFNLEPMKTKKEIEKEIIDITLKIRNEFPELIKYISEMPETFSGTEFNQMGMKNYKKYLNSLKEVVFEYAKTHTPEDKSLDDEFSGKFENTTPTDSIENQN